MKWRTLCSLGFATVLVAATEPLGAPLDYARIDLRDGRQLGDVSIRSFDAGSGKVLLITAGKAIIVPLDQFPAPVAEKVKRDAPKAGETVSTFTPTTPVAEASAAATSPGNGVQIVRPKPMVLKPNTPAPALPPAVTSTAEATAAQIAAHKEAALSRAENYFRYELQAGSNNIKVSALDFETGDPQPVTGWPGRYRTEGKAFVEYYDSKGNSFQRTTSRFEVVTEQKPGEPIHVESFTRKS